MPNVPNVPGVPALTSYAANPVVALATQALSVLLGVGGNIWGIYLDGALAFDVRSVISLEFKQDWAVANYPVEPGSFVSYDKVQLPAEVMVRITSGGTEAERQALLDQVEAAADDLNLYDIVTPEKVYQSYNIARYGYRRTSDNGVGRIIIEIVFQQIREGQTAAFTNTQQPGNAGQTGTGNVQPVNIPGPGNIQAFPIQAVQ